MKKNRQAGRHPRTAAGPGEPWNYFLRPGYLARARALYFEDREPGTEDTVYQPEVYPLAAHLARRLGCSRIIDLGCAKAAKLVPLHPEFKIVGIDHGPNLDYCRRQYPFGEWLDQDLEAPELSELQPEALSSSLIVCADVIEHLVEPDRLLALLRRWMDHAPAAILTTPEREAFAGPDDLGPPDNPCHVREWSLPELKALLLAHGLVVEFMGLTLNNDHDRQKTTALAVLANRRAPEKTLAPREFRVAAVLANGKDRALTELTRERLTRAGVEVQRLETADPEKIFKTLKDREADWVVWLRPGEALEPPWPGMNLIDGLWRVDRSGFNLIDQTPIAWFVKSRDLDRGPEPWTRARSFAFEARACLPALPRAWKRQDFDSMPGTAGPGPGARVYPYNFLLKRLAPGPGDRAGEPVGSGRFDPEAFARTWLVEIIGGGREPG